MDQSFKCKKQNYVSITSRHSITVLDLLHFPPPPHRVLIGSPAIPCCGRLLTWLTPIGSCTLRPTGSHDRTEEGLREMRAGIHFLASSCSPLSPQQTRVLFSTCPGLHSSLSLLEERNLSAPPLLEPKGNDTSVAPRPWFLHHSWGAGSVPKSCPHSLVTNPFVPKLFLNYPNWDSD